MIGPLPQDPFFKNQRRAAISQHATQIGIDYVEFDSEEKLLKLYFIPAAPEVAEVKKKVRPAITMANLRLQSESGLEQRDIRATGVNAPAPDSNHVLEITLEYGAEALSGGDLPVYRLDLINVPSLDPFFAQVNFSLQVDKPSQFDPQVLSVAPAEPLSAPEIDYLAKDYSSFRQLMLNRLSVLIPQWQERNASDLGIALVEVMAYVADRLSYYQDAVATEAYISTARKRVSMRRHARLIDYAMHEGCNARVWVQVEVNHDPTSTTTLPAGSKLLSKVAGLTSAVLDAPTYQDARIQGATVFETMHEIELKAKHNQMPFYTWGAREFYLPQGSTSAILKGHFADLKVGQVLLFEELVDPITGEAAKADPAHRHAVRLSEVILRDDPLGVNQGQAITEIRWHHEDALPFPLHISTKNNIKKGEISVARGNIVLADHGRTIENEALQPATPPSQGMSRRRRDQGGLEGGQGRYYPHLRYANLTFRVRHDHTLVQSQSASATLQQEPRQATPAIKLTQNGSDWLPLRDLLDSDRFTRAFVVEMESDGRAYLRFGDGVHAKQPLAGRAFSATYRVGNGLAGNIGAQAITHLVAHNRSSSELVGRVIKVNNLLAAAGGLEPEPLSDVRLYAPNAFRQQERCVTAEDYAAIAKRHPEVENAAASFRWSGSWYTAVLTVKRVNNKPLDAAFQKTLLDFMEPYRVVGYDITIRAPRLVALDIALTVHVANSHFASSVKQSLIETFSAVDLPNGTRGFFHPDNFTFGQPVYLSKIIADATNIPGVVWVQATRFQRWGPTRQDQLEAGLIPIKPLELAQLNNNQPAGPKNGRLVFEMKGGR